LAVIGINISVFELKDLKIMYFVAKRTGMIIKVFFQPVCKLVVIVRVNFYWIKNCCTDKSLSKNYVNFMNPGLQGGGEK
jgi:hypothetical protein